MKAPIQETKEFQLCPAGTFPARVVQLVHLGTADWYGKGEKKNNVRVTFELPTKLMAKNEDGKELPFFISKEMSFSMYKEAGLRKITHACMNAALTDSEAEAFDVDEIVGKACLINVIHKAGKGDNADKTYANFESASPLVEGMEVAEAVNPLVIFSLDDFKQDVFDNLYSYVQDKIKKSDEYIALQQPEEVKSGDVPF